MCIFMCALLGFWFVFETGSLYVALRSTCLCQGVHLLAPTCILKNTVRFYFTLIRTVTRGPYHSVNDKDWLGLV